MAATYQILRLEITKDREGRDEVFADVQIIDSELGIINYPRWYQGSMAQAIIQDESAINGFVESMIPGLLAQKRIDLANPTVRPEINPPILGDI